MNTDRLQTLRQGVQALKPEQVLSRVWVELGSNIQQRAFLSDLPDGSKASVVGWLPRIAPAAWCWVTVFDGKGWRPYPVFKASVLWTSNRKRPCKDHAVQVRALVWRQVQEWLEYDGLECERILTGERDEVLNRLNRLVR